MGKDNYFDNIKLTIKEVLRNFSNISGCVISENSYLDFLKDLNIDIIANYTFNVFNTYTLSTLSDCGFSKITLSPELDENEISEISSNNSETIVYGKIPIMTMSSCLLGKSNKCYANCKKLCLNGNNFYLTDRYNFKFKLIPDNTQTLTTIYNSRNISLKNVRSGSLRYDFMDEDIDEINKLIT